MHHIELHSVSKTFPGHRALDDLSISVDKGAFYFLLGPSGCGKSTLLRIIAGLEKSDTGTVMFNGEDVTKRPPQDRNISMVFQNYALWPHMTVFNNVAFALEIAKFSKTVIKQRVDEALSDVRLERLADRYPHELSGGQQQRVALARALAQQANLMLLDEPMSNLDAQLRTDIRAELGMLHNEKQITIICATHDQEDALALGTNVAILNQGRVEQLGAPQEIYNEPANPFVAGFLGDTNLLEAKVHSVTGEHVEAQISGLNTIINATRSTASSVVPRPGDPMYLSIRPEAITFTADDRAVDGVVSSIQFLGGSQRVTAKIQNGGSVTSFTSGTLLPVFVVGDKVRLHVEPTGVRAFTPEQL